QSKEELLELDTWDKLAGNTYVATNNGSFAHSGFVTDLLAEKISNYDLVYACGPRPMLSKVSEIARRYNKKHYLVMEEIMACGFGLCMGCALETKQGIKHICKDGPVFDGDQIKWNND
ncbi:MAG: dihydroorotate dehydrogenase electron transfer subunit, partial [Candidatus Margulisiibacteriota bacterium]